MSPFLVLCRPPRRHTTTGFQAKLESCKRTTSTREGLRSRATGETISDGIRVLISGTLFACILSQIASSTSFGAAPLSPIFILTVNIVQHQLWCIGPHHPIECWIHPGKCSLFFQETKLTGRARVPAYGKGCAMEAGACLKPGVGLPAPAGAINKTPKSGFVLSKGIATTTITQTEMHVLCRLSLSSRYDVCFASPPSDGAI